jgi:hypothetical protein
MTSEVGGLSVHCNPNCTMTSSQFVFFCKYYEDHQIKANDMDSTWVYPKVSGLAAWSENCKWYSSLPLDAVVLLFCESV